MTHKTPEELIHGLIDGELTADEQVRRAASGRAGRSAPVARRSADSSDEPGLYAPASSPVDLQAGVLARLEQSPRTTQTKPATTDQPALLRFPPAAAVDLAGCRFGGCPGDDDYQPRQA